jgi:hypothetical protein
LVGVDGKLVIILFIGFRCEIGVLHNGLYSYKNNKYCLSATIF